jgi:cytochrome c
LALKLTLFTGAVLASASFPCSSNDGVNAEQALYESRCGGCHSMEADRVGPKHKGLNNRVAGGVAGYAYSPALTEAGRSKKLVWTAVTLDLWLNDPEALIPGQAMNYSVASAEDRKRIIAYLLR